MFVPLKDCHGVEVGVKNNDENGIYHENDGGDTHRDIHRVQMRRVWRDVEDNRENGTLQCV
jgi:hypothetical protein